MSFTLTRETQGPDLSQYHSDAYRTLIEMFLSRLKNDPATLRQVIDVGTVHRLEGSFYGLLYELNIPPRYHWAYLRVNGFYNSDEFGRDRHNEYQTPEAFVLLKPSIEVIDGILDVDASPAS